MPAHSRNPWHGHRWRGSAWTRVRALASLGMVFGMGAVGTMAAWVDNATMTTGTFSVAALSIEVEEQRDYTEWDLEATGMMPGSTAAAELEVQNAGAVDFNYTVTATADGPQALAESLTLTAYEDANATSDGTACTGSVSIGSAPLAGENAGELGITPRRLNVEGSEKLCFQVELSTGVKKAASNQAVTVTVEFTAEEA